MQKLVTKLTERGQVSVPSTIRRRMKLKPGDQMIWENVSDTECRVTISSPQKPLGAKAMLGYAKTFRATRSTDDWMRELREGEES